MKVYYKRENIFKMERKPFSINKILFSSIVLTSHRKENIEKTRKQERIKFYERHSERKNCQYYQMHFQLETFFLPSNLWFNIQESTLP